MTDKYPHLREDMPHILQNCEDLGMASPYVACFVGSNGAVLVRRYTGWDRFEELAEHTEVAPGMYEDMALPINIMVVDRNGDGMRATISPEKGLTFHQ
jgi:hypothetical protein